MRKPLVSIIIPVYNTEKWLNKCIDSVVNQTYRNVEILLINDGSTDESPEICNKYARLDDRVRVFHKSNSGVSSSRNFGLDKAKGSYVVFVDSDDYLANDIIEKGVNVITQTATLLCLWNYKLVDNEQEYFARKIYLKKCTQNELLCSAISIFTDNKNYDFGNGMRAVWGKMFDLNLINAYHLRFNDKLYIGEDAVFLFEYLKCINKKISVINDYGYYYRRVDNSACKRYKQDLLEQNQLQWNVFNSLLSNIESVDSKLTKYALAVLCWNIFSVLISNELKTRNDCLEAKKWFLDHKKILRKIYWNKYIPKRVVLHMLISFLPIDLQCKVVQMHVHKK